MTKSILLYTMLACATLTSCTNKQLQVSSPNDDLSVVVSVDSVGSVFYSINKSHEALIENSPMGFMAANGLNLGSKFTLKGSKHTSVNEEWTQPWGENKQNRNHYNEMVVELENNDVELDVIFRVFDNGVGFRYDYKINGADSVYILDELTTFAIAEQATTWSIPANFETYELLYRTMPLDSMKSANTPMTFKTKSGVYGSIHEAALTDFPEMTLLNSGNGTLVSELAHWPDGVKAKMSSEFVTPWRTIQIGDKAVDLINSALILNLNEPSVIEDTSWIKPMKYVGVWWAMHLGTETWAMDERHGATTENGIKYIDFAAAHDIQGVLFEGWNEGWENWGGSQYFDYTKPYADFDIVKITEYAKSKGVEILGHHETGGFIANYESQMTEAFEWYGRHGVKSVKTGYAGAFKDGHSHHGQYGVRHYRKVVQEAARQQVTINAHEPIKPTGIRRTYPNMMTREGARGMEWNAWSDGNPTEHYLLLPFTRLLAGPMDYTPGTFDVLLEKSKSSPNRRKWNGNDKGTSRVNSTLVKQIANWVILYSPLQMASDLIEHYDSHPAFQFFVDFDADCDWSMALDGEIGEYLVVVRRAGDKYFLGASTNEDARRVDVSLDFLDSDKRYLAQIYADGDNADWKTNPTDYKIMEQEVDSKSVLNIKMASGGGQAIVFKVLK